MTHKAPWPAPAADGVHAREPTSESWTLASIAHARGSPPYAWLESADAWSEEMSARLESADAWPEEMSAWLESADAWPEEMSAWLESSRRVRKG